MIICGKGHKLVVVKEHKYVIYCTLFDNNLKELIPNKRVSVEEWDNYEDAEKCLVNGSFTYISGLKFFGCTKCRGLL